MRLRTMFAFLFLVMIGTTAAGVLILPRVLPAAGNNANLPAPLALLSWLPLKASGIPLSAEGIQEQFARVQSEIASASEGGPACSRASAGAACAAPRADAATPGTAAHTNFGLQWQSLMQAATGQRTKAPSWSVMPATDAPPPAARAVVHGTAPPLVASGKPTVDLAAAVLGQMVRVEAMGGGLTGIRLTVSPRRARDLILTVGAGTTFHAADARVQSMVVRSDTRIEMGSRPVTLMLPVACMNMRRETPTAKDRLRPGGLAASEPLRHLVATANFQQASFDVQQYAVWTISDNPARSEFVGLAENRVIPVSVDFRRVATLLQAAGLRPEQFRAFQDIPPAGGVRSSLRP